MSTVTDTVHVAIPREVLADIVQLSGDLTDRMHQLLERNTDGALSAAERRELASLTRIAEFGQIVRMALSPADPR